MPTVTLAPSPPRSITAIDVPLTTAEVKKLPAARRRIAKLQGFDAKPGQTLLLAGADGPAEVLVGLGRASEVTADRIRQAAAAYARVVAKHDHVACTLAAGAASIDAPEAIHAVTEGMRLATYRYTAYKEKSPVKLKRVSLIASGRGLRQAVVAANAVVDAVELARDMVNQPGGSLTPEAFVARAKRATSRKGLRVSVWDEARIEKERLGGLMAVNQGSENPARFLSISYTPKGRRPKASVALVGKGITFDSGGLSLKTATGMMTMKIDMAGGAAVLAAMTTLAALDVSVAVTGYIPLTDNMTGGNAQRPGDVFTARNGKTVEVLNTDAEGRLVLADALALASESKPDAIIDIATLTGSASGALGTGYA
ncbi:MAG: leucyl aminopeptidase family protein, partial [Acidimicrobiales bacterium]